MAYSMITMRKEIEQVYFTDKDAMKEKSPFAWEEKKGQVAAGLKKQFPHGRPGVGQRGHNFLNDVLEYCWLVYSKSLEARGPQMIGRTGDLWVAEHLGRVGIDLDAKQTLWDTHTKGNVQVMDKWAPVVNDCWVLGGIHRRANFQLVSSRTLDNLWNFGEGYHVVTAREILGLLHFGYTKTEHPGSKVAQFTCTDAAAAQNASIRAYSSLMAAQQALGPNSIRFLVSGAQNLKLDIMTFDRSRLKQVSQGSAIR